MCPSGCYRLRLGNRRHYLYSCAIRLPVPSGTPKRPILILPHLLLLDHVVNDSVLLRLGRGKHAGTLPDDHGRVLVVLTDLAGFE
jgi:hypothetical protein